MFREQRISLVHKQGDDNNLNFFSFLFVCVKQLLLMKRLF